MPLEIRCFHNLIILNNKKSDATWCSKSIKYGSLSYYSFRPGHPINRVKHYSTGNKKTARLRQLIRLPYLNILTLNGAKVRKKNDICKFFGKKVQIVAKKTALLASLAKSAGKNARRSIFFRSAEVYSKR